MNTINEEFNIPYYIFEEITEYLELTAKGHCKCMKWENIVFQQVIDMVNNAFAKIPDNTNLILHSGQGLAISNETVSAVT